MSFFNTDFQLFRNPRKRDPMPKMTVVPEPVKKTPKVAVPVTDFINRLSTTLGNRMAKEGMLEARAITGKDLYPGIITENHDALMQSPQFKGLRLDKERFTYFLGVNFFCLGVIHRHWEEQLEKKTDRFGPKDMAQMNKAVKKKKDNYALAFEYLGQDPKSAFGQALAKLLNDMSDKANALAGGRVGASSDYSRAYAQVLFQAGYALYGAFSEEKHNVE